MSHMCIAQCLFCHDYNNNKVVDGRLLIVLYVTHKYNIYYYIFSESFIYFGLIYIVFVLSVVIVITFFFNFLTIGVKIACSDGLLNNGSQHL